MTKLMRIILAFLGVNVLVATVCPELPAASAPGKFMIGHAAMNARVAPLWVVEDLGFFAKQGVSVNAIFIRQAPVLAAAPKRRLNSASDIYSGGSAVIGMTSQSTIPAKAWSVHRYLRSKPRARNTRLLR